MGSKIITLISIVLILVYLLYSLPSQGQTEQEELTAQIELNTGWNLISLPLEPYIYAIQSVLQSIDGSYLAVWAYENPPGRWKRFIPGASDNTLGIMEHDKAYWINMREPAILIITGRDVSSSPIRLETGWNLVGFNSLEPLLREDALESIDNLYYSVWTYVNGGWLRYIPGAFGNNLNQMDSGMGFWINAQENCRWMCAGAGLVVINEIMFDPSAGDSGNEWVELYNGSNTSQNLGGWTISNRTGEIATILPDWDLPPDSYLIVFFGIGTNDSDFLDGSGSFYTGNPVEVFDNAEDECALYTGTPSTAIVIDFVSWCFDGDYNPGQAHDYAVSAGIWDSGDFFEIINTPGQLGLIMLEGETIGRDKDSTDTNQPDDWCSHGGRDARGPTPGEQNLYILIPVIDGPNGFPQKEWTIMVYMVADGTFGKKLFGTPMDFAAISDIFEMAKGKANNSDINVVVQIDFLVQVEGSAMRGYIKRNSFVVCQNLVEVDMGNPNTLVNFVNWAKRKFPANRYALITWGHGKGWKGLLPDRSSFDDCLSMEELRQALQGINNILGKKLDLHGFMSCLMAMSEVAYQLKDFVDVMVASEEVIYVPDWDFERIVQALEENPAWEAERFGEEIVNIYSNPFRKPTDTLSAININKIEELKSAVDHFAIDLIRGLEDYMTHYTPDDNVQKEVKNAMLATERFHDNNFKDLYDFAKKVEISEEYRIYTQEIMSLLQENGTIIIEECHGPGHPNVKGLSIYFPKAEQKRDKSEEPYNDPSPSPKKYHEPKDFLFPQETQWDEFLLRYYKPVADAGASIQTQGLEIKLDGSGSSDSDGEIKTWEWDLGDGRKITGKVIEEVVYAPRDKADCYKVTLTVKDDEYDDTNNKDKKDVDTAIVVVGGEFAAEANGPYVGNEGLAIMLTGAVEDTDPPLIPIHYDFYPAKIFENPPEYEGPEHWGRNYNGSPLVYKDGEGCVYRDNGDYNFKLSVQIRGFLFATLDHALVTINNVPPTIEDLAETARAGNQITLQGTARDPGTDDLTFIWDWGDGRGWTVNPKDKNSPDPDKGRPPDPDTPSPDGEPCEVVDTAPHTYDAPGVYTITLTVRDDDYGLSKRTLTITVP